MWGVRPPVTSSGLSRVHADHGGLGWQQQQNHRTVARDGCRSERPGRRWDAARL